MPLELGKTATLIDNKLSRFMPIMPPLGLILGFFLPDVFIQLRPLTPWFLSIMTFSGALRMRVSEFGSAVRNPLPILTFFVFARILMPIYIFFASSLVFGDTPDTISGFVLLYATPTAVSAFIWVTLFHGDKALGLTLILFDTLLSPLIMPFTISVLMGTNIIINTGGIIISLIFMVVLPTIVGVILNETSRSRIPALISPYFNPLAKVSILLIIAGNASSILPGIQLNDVEIWKVAGFCILFTVTVLMLARLTAFVLRYDYGKAVAFTLMGGLRNTSATITIAAGFFPEAVALPALISILFQQTLSGFVGKLFFRKTPDLSS